jgi:RimJ/RimL family protein N-acetyltransferase
MANRYRPMAMQLETDRLGLRPWQDDDVEAYRALVAERGEGTPSVENVTQRIATQRADTARTGFALLAIVRRDQGDFIGYCGLIVGRSTVDEPEIAYELHQHAHGHGYATEAAGAIVDAAAATGRTRLWATVASWNTASFRVLDKLGFERHHTSEYERGTLVWLTCALRPRLRPSG